MEMIGTVIFVSLIMAIKYNTPSKESVLGAFSVSLTLYGMIKMIGASTGGCLNPAVGLIQQSFMKILIKSEFQDTDF